MNKSKVICIMGPTASGKTATALALAKQFPCEIISVDSALVYRGMDIGTAKPTAEEQAAVPHHLIDICDPSNSYSAGMFYQAAEKLIADILKRGRTPLLVGGTMLYFRAIQKGIAFLPAAEIAVRKNLETELLHQGLDHLYTRLKALDPGSAARIDGNDSQRILRALEVYEISGKSITTLWNESRRPGLPYEFINLALVPSDRLRLHKKIAERFELMMQQGFLNEVETLYNSGKFHKNLPSMRSVGYRQIWNHLEGEYDLNTAVEKSIIASRRLAKRQLTWIRHWDNIQLIDSLDKNLINRVLETVETS